MDKEELHERRRRRIEFLQALYHDVDADVNQFVDGYEIAARVGAEQSEAKRIIAYLEEKGSVKVDDHKAGIIRITADGIDVVESGAAEKH
jgi:predicted transcriptional regulator